MQDGLKTALLRHNQNMPRYTSYPPANFFMPSGDDSPYRNGLASLSPGTSISLYLHIPFCPKMCWFCGCHTQATTRYDPVRTYLDFLKMEIQLVARYLPHHITIDHVHFGGGSPTILTPDDFRRTIDTLADAFPFTSQCKIAVEIDPRQITSAHLDAYASSGVSRVSLGVQDIDDQVMHAINRIQPFETTARVVDLCHAHGIDDINVDLVYGLPYQTVPGIETTAHAVCGLSPNRLAVFGYAHVPWMKKHMRLIADDTLPGAEARFDLFDACQAVIQSHGYIQIGIDHFARPDDALAVSAKNGTMRRNFQGYVPAHENLPIIGLGVSSISELPFGYAQNTIHMPQYRDALEAGRLPTARTYALSYDDRVRARIIERLMCTGQINLADFSKQPETDFAFELQDLTPLFQDGLATYAGTILNASHPLAIRMVATAFDTHRQGIAKPMTQRHAAAV